MNVLIVDDEALTRAGLITAIPWDSLGQFHLFEAEDGISALSLARNIKPEIILCDVRMPRMNGIELVEQLEKEFPNSAFIFMSGYSDKEYLKAAIRLNAVSYVEKPLNPEELTSAIKEAYGKVMQNIKKEKNERFYSRGTSSLLASALTHPYQEKKEMISSMVHELGLKSVQKTNFISFVLKLEQNYADTCFIEDLFTNMSKFISRFHLQAFYMSKYTQYHVFHLYSSRMPSEKALLSIGIFLKKQLEDHGAYYISIGKPASGISKAYDSYESALLTLQSSFFFEPGTLFLPGKKEKSPGYQPRIADGNQNDFFLRFSQTILSKSKTDANDLLKKLHKNFYMRKDLLPYEAKEFYYQLFMQLENCRQQMKLPWPDTSLKITILENCFSYDELHSHLVKKAEALLNAASDSAKEESTIFLIKEYIHAHYRDETLSVCDIARHVLLSVAYVCTFFKKETGKTINQYITELRIKKAKELLADSRNQIADISDKIGYSNSNYFSKIFKKTTGNSPSEYRENLWK
ncbi:MAG: response regulator [Hungatella sp.]|jgi:two-component system response regulator YesN|nr:response regulator [Hungatella sp.]